MSRSVRLARWLTTSKECAKSAGLNENHSRLAAVYKRKQEPDTNKNHYHLIDLSVRYVSDKGINKV